MGGTSNAGGRWLARDRQEIGAATDTLGEGGDPAMTTNAPPHALYPLLWRLDLSSLEALASVSGATVAEFVASHGGIS